MPYSALLAWIITLIGASSDNQPMTRIGVFGILILLLISIVEVNSSKILNSQQKIIWSIALLPGNIVAMPLIFYCTEKKLMDGRKVSYRHEFNFKLDYFFIELNKNFYVHNR